MAKDKEEKPAGAPEEGGGEPAPAPGGKKKLLLGGGGAIALLALAWVAATLAVPSKTKSKELGGPFVAQLTSQKVQVNLSESKSFLTLDLNIIYQAYDEAYYATRSQSALYKAELKDVLVEIASAKTREEVSDKVSKPIFMEEIRQAVDPLLFPVHLGDASDPTRGDSVSGIGPGLSAHLNSFRGLHHEHVLAIDAVKRTIRLDDGPAVTWAGEDSDLAVPSADDTVIFVDMSGLRPDFQGEVKVGAMGRLRRILWNEVLIQ